VPFLLGGAAPNAILDTVSECVLKTVGLDVAGITYTFSGVCYILVATDDLKEESMVYA
jgi:hypothetical protein